TTSFTASPTNGGAPLTVTFNDASTGNETNWLWNFGDGKTTNVPVRSVGYTYATAGVYTVMETVTGLGGASTATRSHYVTVLTPQEASLFQAWLTQYFNCTNCIPTMMSADTD